MLSHTSLEEILAFVNAVPFDAIRFILDAARLNGALSQEGLRGSWGLHIGSTLAKQCDRGLLAKDLSTAILIRTSAASDARMGGATFARDEQLRFWQPGDYRHGASHGGC